MKNIKNKIAKCVYNAITEAFDFNKIEMNNNLLNDSDIDNYYKPLIIELFKKLHIVVTSGDLLNIKDIKIIKGKFNTYVYFQLNRYDSYNNLQILFPHSSLYYATGMYEKYLNKSHIIKLSFQDIIDLDNITQKILQKYSVYGISSPYGYKNSIEYLMHVLPYEDIKIYYSDDANSYYIDDDGNQQYPLKNLIIINTKLFDKL